MKNGIVIVGGMGPQASIELHRRIIENCAFNGASEGSDFPEIVHFSLPIDDFISDASKISAAQDMILSRLEHLYLWRQRPNYYGV